MKAILPSCPLWNESLQAKATRFPGTPEYIFVLPLLKGAFSTRCINTWSDLTSILINP
jgi:hypothetical protein